MGQQPGVYLDLSTLKELRILPMLRCHPWWKTRLKCEPIDVGCVELMSSNYIQLWSRRCSAEADIGRQFTVAN